MRSWEKHEVLAKTCLIFFSTIIGISIVELLLQVEYKSRSLPEEQVFHYCNPHPLFGWAHIPNYQGYIEKKEFKYLQKFNSKGNRSKDYDFLKPDNTIRVLVLGDSFTEGLGVEDGKMFTSLLEDRLNRENDAFRYEVINAGVVGYSIDQEYSYFENEGLKYNPDIVILMLLPYNDIIYTIMDVSIQTSNDVYPKPRYVLKGQNLELTNIPLPIEKKSLALTDSSSFENLKKILRHLRIYHLLVDSVGPYLRKYGIMKQLVSRDAKHIMPSQHTPDMHEIYMKEYNQPTLEAWDLTKRFINEIKNKQLEKNGYFILFIVPLSFQLDKNELQLFSAKHGLNPTWDIEKPGRILHSLCSANSVDCIDPVSTFKEVILNKKTPLYYPVDGHWNAEGHKLVADMLFSHIKKIIISRRLIPENQEAPLP